MDSLGDAQPDKRCEQLVELAPKGLAVAKRTRRL